MIRVEKNSDIQLNLSTIHGLGQKYIMTFYTVNKKYCFTKTDEDAININGVLYMPLSWSELQVIGRGVLQVLVNNTAPNASYDDGEYNNTFITTTKYYINSPIIIDDFDEDTETITELLAELATNLDNETTRSTTKDAATDTEIGNLWWNVNKANNDIDKTTMRVYRDGDYNIDQCLYYGYWFGCTTGRPNPSVAGETYSVEVENVFEGDSNMQSLRNKTQSDGGWDGAFGYFVGPNSQNQTVNYVERFYGNYPATDEEICSQTICGIPNGTYTLKVYFNASSTQERDQWMRPPILDQYAFNISINGESSNWDCLAGNNYAQKQVAITDPSKVSYWSKSFTVTDNKIDIRIKAGLTGTANWFTFFFDELKRSGDDTNYIDRGVQKTWIIKQTASSSFDATKEFQRLIFTTDRSNYYAPATVYGDWYSK